MEKNYVQSKRSEYKVYRELKYQEEINRKDKYDNRLYLSFRYKSGYSQDILREIFPRQENLHTLRTVVVNKK
jgi:hypothetical protein